MKYKPRSISIDDITWERAVYWAERLDMPVSQFIRKCTKEMMDECEERHHTPDAPKSEPFKGEMMDCWNCERTDVIFVKKGGSENCPYCNHKIDGYDHD